MTDLKEFMEKQKIQLAEWRRQIDDLNRKGKKIRVDTSVKFDNYIDDLRMKWDDVQNRLSEMQQGGESSWTRMRTGVDAAWKELKDTFEKAKKRFP